MVYCTFTPGWKPYGIHIQLYHIHPTYLLGLFLRELVKEKKEKIIIGKAAYCTVEQNERTSD